MAACNDYQFRKGARSEKGTGCGVLLDPGNVRFQTLEDALHLADSRLIGPPDQSISNFAEDTFGALSVYEWIGPIQIAQGFLQTIRRRFKNEPDVPRGCGLLPSGH